MKKQGVLVVAALAVALIVALLAWLVGDEQAPVQAANNASPHDAARVGATSQSTPASSQDDGPRTASNIEPTPGVAETPPPQTQTLAEGEGLDVLVLDKKTELPITDAKLTYLAAEEVDGEYFFSSLLRESRLDELLEKNGTRYSVDEQGRARVPTLAADAAIVVASARDQWGFALIGKLSDPPIKVMLARDANLAALVVDEGGAPVGDAVVVLRMHGYNGGWSYDAQKTRSRATDGLAVLAHGGASLGNQEFGLDNRWSIALGAVLDKPVEVALVPSKLPSEPVRLVVPASGECEVTVLDTTGQPYTDKVDVTLRLITREELDNNPDVDNNYGQPPSDQSLELNDVVGGRVLFHHVQPGALLEASVQRHGNYQRHVARGPGPTSAGQRASITVRLGSNTPIIAGRAVSPDGVALADTELHSKISYVGQPMWSNYTAEIRSDASGRFLVDVDEHQGNTNAREFTLYTAGDDGVELAFTTRELPPVLGPGLHEFGDFVLQPSAVIVAGKVVDEEGRPVKHAWITPAVKQTWNEDDDDSFWWQDLWEYRCQSDAEGNFALRGRMQSRELGLRAEAEKRKSEMVTALPGARDVVLRLIATGEIAGQVLLDSGVSRDGLQVRATPVVADSGNEQPFEWREPVAIDEDGKFAFKDLKAGNYTVTLQTMDSNTELASVENVRVERGAIARDPRLNPLDLRGSLHPIVLSIFNEQNEAILEGNVGIAKSNATGGETEYQYFERGKLVVYLPRGQPIDVTVMCDGYRGVTLHNVATDQRIVLKRTVSVRLVLARGLKLPDEPLVVGARIESVGGQASEVEMWSDNSANFESNGELVIASSIVGPAKITLTITYQSDENWTSTDYSDNVPRTIEIADTQREQRFEVTFDRAKLDEQSRAVMPGAQRRDG